MYELMICVNDDSYMYFSTKQMTAREAFSEFVDICERVRINIDNMKFTSAVLRDKNGEDIDRIGWN